MVCNPIGPLSSFQLSITTQPYYPYYYNSESCHLTELFFELRLNHTINQHKTHLHACDQHTDTYTLYFIVKFSCGHDSPVVHTSVCMIKMKFVLSKINRT